MTPRRTTSSPLAWLAAVSLLGGACGFGRQGDPAGAAIAEIGGRPILLSEFEPVLARTLEGSASAASAEVKSRLFDQFLDEQILLEEARRRGIRAEDAEVEQALAAGAGEQRSDDPAYRERLRATLTVDKLVRQYLEEAAPVAPEEEEAYYREHEGEFHRPAVVVLRQILLDDRAAAQEVRARVASDPQRFDEVALERSLSADRGRARTFALDELPDEVSRVVADLDPGAITPVIERPPDFLIFKVEGIKPSRSLSLEEARPEIRARLRESRGAGALAQFLADLKVRLGVQLHAENLPFDYVRETPA